MARFMIVAVVLALAAGARAQTNITVGKMTVDGQEVRELKCNLKKAGFFAVATVVGALAKQKKALDACVPGGAAFQVEWKWDGAKAQEVVVTKSSAKGKNKCFAAAVAKATSTAEGTCSAIVLVGKAEAAGKAADALK
jgi:hypothetical protein